MAAVGRTGAGRAWRGGGAQSAAMTRLRAFSVALREEPKSETEVARSASETRRSCTRLLERSESSVPTTEMAEDYTAAEA